jgi:phosphomannomutase / phosphoglucomutase
MVKYIYDIRGEVNSEITNKFASHLGTVIGNYLGPGESVVLGRDFNTPSQMIKRSISTGLMSAGINVIDFGIAPIPVIHYVMHLYQTNVMVTVAESDLRPKDVSIKIFSKFEIPLEQRHGDKVTWNSIGELRYAHEYIEEYIKAVLKKAATKIIKSKSFLVVADCEMGSSEPITPKILNKLGCETVTIGFKDTKHDLKFTKPGPERLSLDSEVTTTVGADIGIILDNDRDGVIFIDEGGNIIRDQTILGIFARDALIKENGGTVVSSVVASLSLDDVVSEYGGNLIKTSVNHVLKEVIDNDAVFGGDEPGMYVFPEFQKCYDGIFSVVRLLEILARNDTTLSKLTKEIEEYPRTFFTLECEQEKKMKVINTIKSRFDSYEDFNTVDGLRVEMEDSFILLRPSRFEPLIRIYIESKSSKKLQRLTASIKKIIENV